jgi:NDP-sugar pyrophosphorylase family protein
MKALILAAGKGTRLRPITDYIPKPMVPLHGKPLLEWVLLHLISYGIKDYIIAVSYLAEQIENYFGDGGRWGINIQYSRGSVPAGKAGEVWRARDLLNSDSRFLVIPGDTISHMDYQSFIEFHEQHGGVVSVALSTKYRLEVGLAEVDENSKIINFIEKANLDQPVSTGTYILEREIFPYIEKFNPTKSEVDLPGDVFPVLLHHSETVHGYIRDYDWWDIGRVNDYEAIAHMPPEQAIHMLKGPNSRS